MKTHLSSRRSAMRSGALAAFLAGLLFAPVLQAQYTVGVYANASPLGASADLHDVESVQPDMTLFQKSYFVDYDWLRGIVKQALQDKITQSIQQSKTIDCPFPCDEVRWSVTPTADIVFLDKQQPVLTLLSSSQNAVRVSLNTNVKTTLHVAFTGEADVWPMYPTPLGLLPGAKTEHVSKSITVDIAVTGAIAAQADVYLYPDVKVDNVSVQILQDVHTDVNGIPSTLALMGATAGSVIGFTPGGIASGGPLAWGFTAALFGDKAGAILQGELESLIDLYVASALADGQAKVMTELQSLLGNVQQINNVKNQFMNTPIAGLNGSLNSLKNQMGLDLDVRTVKSGTDVKTIVTARYNGRPNGGKVNVNFVLPEERCVQLPGNKHMFEPHNKDIAVGQSCQALFGGGVTPRAFLGETPPATSMSNWKPGGTVSFKGVVKHYSLPAGLDLKTGQPTGHFTNNGWLVCEAEINTLPQAGVVELDLNGKLAVALTDAYNQNHRFLYISGRQVSVGGTGTCDGVEAKGVPETGKPKIISDRLDCPQCLDKLRNPMGEQVQTLTGRSMSPSQVVRGVHDSQTQIQNPAGFMGRSAPLQPGIQGGQFSEGVPTGQMRPRDGFAGDMAWTRPGQAPGALNQRRSSPQAISDGPLQPRTAPPTVRNEPEQQAPAFGPAGKGIVNRNAKPGGITRSPSKAPASQGTPLQPDAGQRPGAAL